jgi:hypothetical protein
MSNTIKYDTVKEVKGGRIYYLHTTPCPNEDNGARIGSMACTECCRFISRDSVAREVVCNFNRGKS